MKPLLKQTNLKRLGNSYAILISKAELKQMGIPASTKTVVWAYVSGKPIRL